VQSLLEASTDREVLSPPAQAQPRRSELRDLKNASDVWPPPDADWLRSERGSGAKCRPV